MPQALIGSTGFVGGNLLRQAPFDALYHSRNIEEIAGRSFDLLVCAGARAEKWKANREPEADRAGVRRLIDCLGTVAACQVVLISTVDVYPHPVGVDEETPIDTETLHSYGQHRYELECAVRQRFDALVVRLPGLFGPGLKKNVIYDFLHGNNVADIHCDGVFQFYDLDHLWADVERARRHGLRLLNLATEPVSVAEVAREAFGFSFTNRPARAPARYDMHSRHAALYGGTEPYLYDKRRVLDELRDFVAARRGGAL